MYRLSRLPTPMTHDGIHALTHKLTPSVEGIIRYGQIDEAWKTEKKGKRGNQFVCTHLCLKLTPLAQSRPIHYRL